MYRRASAMYPPNRAVSVWWMENVFVVAVVVHGVARTTTRYEVLPARAGTASRTVALLPERGAAALSTVRHDEPDRRWRSTCWPWTASTVTRTARSLAVVVVYPVARTPGHTSTGVKVSRICFSALAPPADQVVARRMYVPAPRTSSVGRGYTQDR